MIKKERRYKIKKERRKKKEEIRKNQYMVFILYKLTILNYFNPFYKQ